MTVGDLADGTTSPATSLVSTVPVAAQDAGLVRALRRRAGGLRGGLRPVADAAGAPRPADRVLVSGLDLLVHQAVLQLELFTGEPRPTRRASRSCGRRGSGRCGERRPRPLQAAVAGAAACALAAVLVAAAGRPAARAGARPASSRPAEGPKEPYRRHGGRRPGSRASVVWAAAAVGAVAGACARLGLGPRRRAARGAVRRRARGRRPAHPPAAARGWCTRALALAVAGGARRVGGHRGATTPAARRARLPWSPWRSTASCGGSARRAGVRRRPARRRSPASCSRRSGWPDLVVGAVAGVVLFAVPALVLALVRRDRGLLRTPLPVRPVPAPARCRVGLAIAAAARPCPPSVRLGETGAACCAG